MRLLPSPDKATRYTTRALYSCGLAYKLAYQNTPSGYADSHVSLSCCSGIQIALSARARTGRTFQSSSRHLGEWTDKGNRRYSREYPLSKQIKDRVGIESNHHQTFWRRSINGYSVTAGIIENTIKNIYLGKLKGTFSY